ncbi:hypothetical protein MTR67_016628 [Solanum verrucosum]|uniref:Uncharacterized protein n=1 Tax=Solanum verrucosum TaxID=315347 RepID=A0AAF0TQZ7_SOLVR|nr:hypothetical protein MTR67_016628 [Solanum verrucosum]
MDVAVSGLGWFSLGLKGEADLALWTYDGIQITLREPLGLVRRLKMGRAKMRAAFTGITAGTVLSERDVEEQDKKRQRTACCRCFPSVSMRFPCAAVSLRCLE